MKGDPIPNYYGYITGSNPPQGAPIEWNVNWLLNGWGSAIALVALAGVVISVVAIIIYSSTVQRARPSTEFVGALNNKFSELERQVNSVKQQSPAAPRQTVAPGSQAAAYPPPVGAATIFDRKPQAATIIERPQSGATVRVLSGADSGKIFNLPASDVKIGRDATNFIVLQDGKSSREHAKLQFNGGAWIILDLGSANGTYLNEVQVFGQQPINNGDTIRIGDSNLQFSKVG
jgi:hypothetical protein